MQRSARILSGSASVCLVLVFLALLSCTIWGATTIQRAAGRTLAAVTLSQLYSTLERDLWIEASLVRVHGLDPQGSGWVEERPAAVATETTLNSLEGSDSVADRALARRTRTDHDRYIDVLLVLFSQIDANDPAAPKNYQRSAAIFDAMQGRIDSRAAERHQYAISALHELATTQTLVIRMIAAAGTLGVILLGLCGLVIAGYRRAMARARDEELASLARRSLTDNLTGLGNHRAYQDDLDRELALVGRHGGTTSLAVLDVDNFKNVNDGFGHLHGDRVLANLGDMLRELRKGDRSFRLGGDEFAVLLPHTTLEDAKAVMDRVREDAPRRLFGASLSIGIASIVDSGMLDATSLRAQADAALYAAKEVGRNTVMTFTQACSSALVLSPEKEQAVRRLIDDGNLDVVFQPIWEVGQSEPLGFEALVRPSERYGFTGPQEAFDVAERIGKAPDLDWVCLQSVLARAGEVPNNALLFINIVPESLHRSFIAGTGLLEAVVAAGLTPERVVIELTERAMPHLDIIVREAKRLQLLGFKLALDDTGAGNSGLEILRQLSVQYVKIDRAVLMQAISDPIARAIVAGIVAIARAMHSHIIAEGVETIETLEFVYRDVMEIWAHDMGVFAVQGYLFGRPSHAPWEAPQYKDHGHFLALEAARK